MDGIQRYIANADDRPADEVERADAALAALAYYDAHPEAMDVIRTQRQVAKYRLQAR